jgi:hypothetical protein
LYHGAFITQQNGIAYFMRNGSAIMIYVFWIFCLLALGFVVLAIFGDYMIEPVDEFNDEDSGV